MALFFSRGFRLVVGAVDLWLGLWTCSWGFGLVVGAFFSSGLWTCSWSFGLVVGALSSHRGFGLVGGAENSYRGKVAFGHLFFNESSCCGFVL